MKILCLGQSAYDITLPINGFPKENKKYKIGDVKVECGGGSCNNAAYLLKKWGNDTYLACSIGKDSYGSYIKKELKEIGVNIDYIEEIENVPTSTSYILCNTLNASRTIITNKSPLMHFTKLQKIDTLFDVILVDGNDYDMALKTINEQKKAIKIIDAGSLKMENINLSKKCDYIVCSNDFAKEYSKINFHYDDMDSIYKAYDVLDNDFNGKIVITLESMGSLTKIDGKFYLVPSIKVKSVDSTGAGDIYHGAFTHFIAHGFSLLESMYYANIAGALSVTKIGSKNSIPSLDEVMKFNELR